VRRRAWWLILVLAVGAVAVSVTVVLVPRLAPQRTPPPARSLLRLAGEASDLKIWLTIQPALPGSNRLEAAATSNGADPLPTGTQVFVTFLKLDESLDPLTLPLTAGETGLYAAESVDLPQAGWWQVDVVVRRPGLAAATTTFPLKLGGAAADGAPQDDPVAARLLRQAQTAWASVRTWRETQQLTDGAGNAYTTWLEAERPDRQRFRTSSGVDVVTLGKTRYQRSRNSPWQRYVFANPFVVEGPLYFMRGAGGVRAGRTWPCGAETCRAILWTSADMCIPGGGGTGQRGAQFAAWVELRSHLVRTLLMIEPTHYMTLRYTHVNVPVGIGPPR
jgi:hypothetical protein